MILAYMCNKKEVEWSLEMVIAHVQYDKSLKKNMEGDKNMNILLKETDYLSTSGISYSKCFNFKNFIRES